MPETWSASRTTARLRIGDTLTEGEALNFIGVPSFAPEILRRVRLGDAMKAKKLKQALQELAEEGVVQVFRPHDGSPAMIGVVGPLQLDVLKVRLAEEYGLPVDFDVSEFELARWISSEDRTALDSLHDREPLGHRRRSRRRSGFPRAQPVLSRLHPRARGGDRLHRHQGCEESRGAELKRAPRAGSDRTTSSTYDLSAQAMADRKQIVCVYDGSARAVL